MAVLEVNKFYAGKNIFLTGGTGFVGLCLLEKILRCIPDHGDIYLLMRPKRGKDIKQRLIELRTNSIFERLVNENDQNSEAVFERVFPVAGDVSLEHLGLSTDDRTTVTANVNVIFHSAATLDFGDTLKTTVNVNLLGTRRVLELAKQSVNLVGFVHVSSAYVNSFELNVDEVLYEAPGDAEHLIRLCSELSDQQMELRTPVILGKHPNTYTITKHFAEHEVKKYESDFRCAIVRPSMIIGAWREPVPGWTNSKNGPQGFLMGAAKGVIRRLPVGIDIVYDYVPVDMVVNSLLVAGCYTQAQTDLQIYHCTSSTRNPFKWSLIKDEINTFLHDYPLNSAVWYPNLKFVPNVLWYKISAFFVHILPALILDGITKIAGGRPILIKLHRNVNTSLGRLERFIFTEWKFHADKLTQIQRQLTKGDQDLYVVDPTNLVWLDYFRDLAIGARVYLNREPMKTLKKAKTKDAILFYVHMVFKLLILFGITYLIKSSMGFDFISVALMIATYYFFFVFI